MSAVTRETRLLQLFATLADTLVDDYDVVDLLQTLVDSCRDLLDASDAGILLADRGGELELIASTSEAARLVEVMQLAASEGPCIDSYRTGSAVLVPDIADAPDRWARFRHVASLSGFAAIIAIPMRLRDTTIGTLNLLRSAPGDLPEQDLSAARAFADVATIGILHERSFREAAVLTRQLEAALDSRVVIEQAKGVVSFTAQVSIENAFTLIRNHARNRGQRLSDVAAAIVRREIRITPPG